MRKVCAGGAVAAATPKKAPQAVVVKDFEPSKVLGTNRSCLAAVAQNRPNQSLINATLSLGRNLSSGPQCRLQADKCATRTANPTVNYVFGLTCCHEGRAQVFKGLDLFQEYATKVDDVLCPEAWMC